MDLYQRRFKEWQAQAKGCDQDYYGTRRNVCTYALAGVPRALAALSEPIKDGALGMHRTPQARVVPNQYGI